MKDIRFTVPGVPVAQPRPRVYRKGPWASRAVSAPRGDPVHDFKAAVRLMASQVHQGPLLDGSLALSLLFVFPRLACHKKLGPGRHSYVGRKDVDNLAKSVMDSLNHVIWKDDRQVTELRCAKLVAACDEAPHVEVIIWSGCDV